MISDGICYLVLTDKSYPKRLAFLFLEDIAKDFVQELQDEYAEELLFLFKITVNNVSVVGNEQLKLLVDNMLSSNLVELLKCICVIFIDEFFLLHIYILIEEMEFQIFVQLGLAASGLRTPGSWGPPKCVILVWGFSQTSISIY